LWIWRQSSTRAGGRTVVICGVRRDDAGGAAGRAEATRDRDDERVAALCRVTSAR
jgi:hypothetical protein